MIAATTRELSGRYSFGSTKVFVTDGAGFWGPIARLGAPPDVTIFEPAVPGTTIEPGSEPRW